MWEKGSFILFYTSLFAAQRLAVAQALDGALSSSTSLPLHAQLLGPQPSAPTRTLQTLAPPSPFDNGSPHAPNGANPTGDSSSGAEPTVVGLSPSEASALVSLAEPANTIPTAIPLSGGTTASISPPSVSISSSISKFPRSSASLAVPSFPPALFSIISESPEVISAGATQAAATSGAGSTNGSPSNSEGQPEASTQTVPPGVALTTITTTVPPSSEETQPRVPPGVTVVTSTTIVLPPGVSTLITLPLRSSGSATASTNPTASTGSSSQTASQSTPSSLSTSPPISTITNTPFPSSELPSSIPTSAPPIPVTSRTRQPTTTYTTPSSTTSSASSTTPPPSSTTPTSSATMSAAAPTASPNSSGKLSGGAVAGIAVGAVAGVALAGAALFYFLRRRQAAAAAREPSTYPEEAYLYDPPIPPSNTASGTGTPSPRQRGAVPAPVAVPAGREMTEDPFSDHQAPGVNGQSNRGYYTPPMQPMASPPLQPHEGSELLGGGAAAAGLATPSHARTGSIPPEQQSLMRNQSPQRHPLSQQQSMERVRAAWWGDS